MENKQEQIKVNAVEKTKQAIINAIDENGNGEIDLEDVIIKGLKIPGIKINLCVAFHSIFNLFMNGDYERIGIYRRNHFNVDTSYDLSILLCR